MTQHPCDHQANGIEAFRRATSYRLNGSKYCVCCPQLDLAPTELSVPSMDPLAAVPFPLESCLEFTCGAADAAVAYALLVLFVSKTRNE